MSKTMDDWKKEAEQKRNEDRKRLLAISDTDAEKLPTPDRYQRMRYQREIEAAEWLAAERKKLPVMSSDDRPKKKRYRAYGSNSWID